MSRRLTETRYFQLGTALGPTVSTIVFNRVTLRQPEGRPNLESYHAAQWTAFAFGVLGIVPPCYFGFTGP